MREPVPPPVKVSQPGVSSLHAVWVPVVQLPARMYTTVSNRVLVPAQVEIVAVPDRAGVHWNTFSGALPVLPQLPLAVLLPLVVPPNEPPAAGITVGLVQDPPEGGGGGGGGGGGVPLGGVTVRRKLPLLLP
jgi:hypothetical protein